MGSIVSIPETVGQRSAALCQSSDGWQLPAAIGEDEWGDARPTPDCIVENYLYADVGLILGPGGAGKTTLILFEVIHIALDLPLWGLNIRKPGRVVILTAEDSREILVARLREIAADMKLTNEQIATVQKHVLISDVSASPVKLTAVFDDVVRSNHVVDEIIAACEARPPVLIVIDPVVSFGVGENRVNDAEQGLIEAARKIRNALNCCVRYVHHTGKMNAREKTLDQYSNRGGSALPDGCRMVAVMQPCDDSEWLAATGGALHEGESGLVLARSKLSYAPKPDSPFYIVRRGYRFELVSIKPTNPLAALEAIANQIWQFICNEAKEDRRHTRQSIDAMQTVLNMKRQDIRGAVSRLVAAGRIVEVEDRKPGKRGAPSKFLEVVDLLNSSPETLANKSRDDQ